MCSKAPFQLWAGITRVWRLRSSRMCPQQLVQFWFQGGRLRDLSVHNDIHTAVHSFLFSEIVCCPVVSLCKCASVPCNLLYLHSLVPCTKPRRTRTGVEISSDSISQHNISHPKKATMCFFSFPVVVFTVFVLISYLLCDHSACYYLLKFKEVMLKKFEVCTSAQRTC